MERGCLWLFVITAIVGCWALLEFGVARPEKRKAEENRAMEQKGEVVTSGDGHIVGIQFIEFNGHRYLKISNSTHAGHYVTSIEHDPDCPCHNKGN